MSNPVIGVTERGDPSIDKSWMINLVNVDGAIIITKNLTDKLFRESLVINQSKLIVHATCTGLGGSIYEPNVPPSEHQLRSVYQLILEGFPANHIVLRIDPIILPEINRALDVLSKSRILSDLGVTRLRWSSLDYYNHVKSRLSSANLLTKTHSHLNESRTTLQYIDQLIGEMSPLRSISTCAEVFNQSYISVSNHEGCVSKTDLDILGLSYDEDSLTLGNQREKCNCLSCKIELLSNRHPCNHKCLYCYWKD